MYFNGKHFIDEWKNRDSIEKNMVKQNKKSFMNYIPVNRQKQTDNEKKDLYYESNSDLVWKNESGKE